MILFSIILITAWIFGLGIVEDGFGRWIVLGLQIASACTTFYCLLRKNFEKAFSDATSFDLYYPISIMLLMIFNAMYYCVPGTRYVNYLVIAICGFINVRLFFKIEHPSKGKKGSLIIMNLFVIGVWIYYGGPKLI